MPAAPPMGSNTTADLYISPNAPPASPDVAGVKIFLQPRHRNIKPSSLYDYIIWCDASIAVYQVAGVQASFYVPDKNGLQYTVNFSAIEGRGTGLARRACYCTRPEPSSAALAADV